VDPDLAASAIDLAALLHGPFGARSMVHTKMVYRNLRVYTDRLPFTELA
jgi:hypothetical protein